MNKQKISLVDLKSEHGEIMNEIIHEITEIFQNSDFIHGKKVRELEKWLANYTQSSYALGCASGTEAIQIAIMSLNLPREAEIIVPAFTYFATVEPALLLGYKVVFADIHPDYFTIDVEDVKNKLTDRTCVIIPVHLYGQCANMEEITRIATEKGIFVIEDCAQALGASIKKQNGEVLKAGSIGTFGCFSFFPTKNLGAAGDGGAITTSNQQLFMNAQMLANHGQLNSKYFHKKIGLNSRLDTIQAAILLIKAKYLSRKIQKKQEIARMYNFYLSDIEEIMTPAVAPYSSHTYHLYTIKVSKRRDELLYFLLSENIEVRIYYPVPVHKQEAILTAGYNCECPVAEKISREVLTLPMHPYLTEENVKYISQKIKEFFSKK
mgnify:CR=1 FL=1